MITLDIPTIIALLGVIASGIYNIIQWQQLRHMKKETFKPIYNGLIGLFNDVKNKVTHCYGRQNLLFARNNPYNTIETLKWNFYEFITETISHFDSFREHIVPILKTVDPSEDRIFKGADFGLTEEEKALRKKFNEKWQIQQEIERKKLIEELEKLKNTKETSKESRR